MRLQPKPSLLFDAETNGLLHQVTVCHCLVIRDVDTGQVRKFRKNKHEDTIAKGLALLDTAEEIIGHNILGYDIPMFELLFDWTPKARIRDTLVLSRALFPDQKDKDFRLFEQGKIDGKNIGKHTLDSWGQRVGKYKGDYKAKREAEGVLKGIEKDSEEMRFFVWGTWTEELEEYCVNDVDVTAELWRMIKTRPIVDDFDYVQHRLADIMVRQQESGFYFDRESAEDLKDELNEAKEKLAVQLEVEFPGRWIPAKKMDSPPIGRRAKGGEFADFGITQEEVDELRWWGVPDVRERDSAKWKDKLRARWTAGSWYTPIKWQEFNPRSRPQITDRLQSLGWEPEDEDYTEKGNVKANDVILRRIAVKYPVASVLADLMAVNKLLGQLADGKNAWLKLVDEDDFIRGYCNPCGAVTTRATHSFPNLAQVPAVRKKKVLASDLVKAPANSPGIVPPTAYLDGEPVLCRSDYSNPDAQDKDGKVLVTLLGLKGGWGYESRSLFVVPKGFVLVGSDLAGIELRCLGHRMASYDGGAYGKELLEGDIHSINQAAAGLETRDEAKTFIYAFLYGAGDEKIGKIISPLLPPHVQRKLGKELKARFLRAIPALNKVIRDTQRQAKRKYLEGIDGRRLFVRSKHAALNTDLQGMGATIANWWVVFIEDIAEERGYTYGWDGDYVNCAWVHDEVQLAVREGLEEEFKEICILAAMETGKYLGFALPVDASAVSGYSWAETH